MVGVLPGGNLPSPNFYTVAAQIIPVLLVALAVEARLRDVWDEMPGTYRSQLIGTLMIGETIAIVAASGVIGSSSERLYEVEGVVGPNELISELMAAATACALVTGFLSVIVVALVKDPLSLGASPRAAERRPAKRSADAGLPPDE